jgi:hypothetical protein
VIAFLVVSGIAFWALAVPSVVIVTIAVVQGVRALRAACRIDPVAAEATKGIGEVEHYLAGGPE